MLTEYINTRMGQGKPKDDMLKKIADALEVNSLALLDPVTTNYIGAMFEMEHVFNMKIEKRSDRQDRKKYTENEIKKEN